MSRLVIFIGFFLFSSFCYSQTGFLFVKKGYKKKRTYTEGDVIHVRLEDGSYRKGMITLLRNDTIFISGQPVPRIQVKQLLLKRKPKKPLPDGKTLVVIGIGAVLVSAGLAISEQAETTQEALLAGPIIGYGPMLIKHFGGRLLRIIPRGKFRIGKKFRLQVLDFHIPRKKPL